MQGSSHCKHNDIMSFAVRLCEPAVTSTWRHIICKDKVTFSRFCYVHTDVVMSRCSHCKHNDITSLFRNVISVSYTYFTATNRISLWSGLIQYRFLSRLINGSQLIRRLKMHTVNRFVMAAEVGDVQISTTARAGY